MALATVIVVMSVRKRKRRKGRVALVLAPAALLVIVSFSTGRTFNGWLSDRLIFLEKNAATRGLLTGLVNVFRSEFF